jgi:hypothetical protein
MVLYACVMQKATALQGDLACSACPRHRCAPRHKFSITGTAAAQTASHSMLPQIRALCELCSQQLHVSISQAQVHQAQGSIDAGRPPTAPTWQGWLERTVCKSACTTTTPVGLTGVCEPYATVHAQPPHLLASLVFVNRMQQCMHNHHTCWPHWCL